MSRELEWDGYWEGDVCYTCDCGCNKTVRFRFDSEEMAKDIKFQKKQLKKKGWVFTKVNGSYHDFCSFSCRDRYIRNNTI